MYTATESALLVEIQKLFPIASRRLEVHPLPKIIASGFESKLKERLKGEATSILYTVNIITLEMTARQTNCTSMVSEK